RTASQGADHIAAFAIEADETIARGVRERGSDWPWKAESCNLDCCERRGFVLLRTFGDAGLARQQCCEILEADLTRQHSKEAEAEAEEHTACALRPVTQHRHWYAHATLTRERIRQGPAPVLDSKALSLQEGASFAQTDSVSRATPGSMLRSKTRRS